MIKVTNCYKISKLIWSRVTFIKYNRKVKLTSNAILLIWMTNETNGIIFTKIFFAGDYNQAWNTRKYTEKQSNKWGKGYQ